MGINGYLDPIPSQPYALSVSHHTGTRRGGTMLQVDYSLVTVQDAVYLLSNNNGYFDGDIRCLVIEQ